MSFSISWTDFPEKADISDIHSIYSLVRDETKSIDSLQNISPNLQNASTEPTNSHIFIEGDNYPTLKLLESEFAGKINFIYIDPPYNTGKTGFIYNDAHFLDNSTPSSTPQSQAASSDRQSEWLSFMNRRLQCAKTLLSEDGCIFIAIGEDSLYVLKLLCDSIFGSENFINNFMWLHGKGKKDKFSRTMQESTLCYAKNKKKLKHFLDFEKTDWAKTNADNDERGNWFSGSISFDEKRSNPKHPNFFEITSPTGKKWLRQWLVTKEEMNELLAQNKIYWGTPPLYNNVPRRKIFNGEKTQIIPQNIIESNSTRSAQKYVDSLLGEKNSFDNPKPVELIRHFLKIINMEKNITVLDFFAGSGTTLEAVVSQNAEDGGKRCCILIQKPEKIAKTSQFETISDLCYERIKKVLPKEDRLEYLRLSQS